MWRRWSGNSQQPQIGWPTDFRDMDQEDRYLETIPEVESISSKRQSAVVTLPALPFRAVPPMDQMPQRDSIYSQPSTSAAVDHSGQPGLRIDTARTTDVKDEVSPITPRSSRDRSRYVPDDQPISPIESSQPTQGQATLAEQNFTSQIPRPSRNVVSGADTTETRWDRYSGEPTNNENGVSSTMRPGTQPLEMQYPQLKERTKQILAGLRDREQARKTPWGKQPPPVAPVDPLDQPVNREPWRGASGRTALVAPLKNTPGARKGPIHYPQRNVSLMKTTEEAPITNDPVPVPTYAYQDGADYEPQSSPVERALRSTDSQESIKPVVPLKSSKRPMSPGIAPESMRNPLDDPHQDIQSKSVASPIHIELPTQQRVDSPTYEAEPTTPQTPPATIEPEIIQSTEDHAEPMDVSSLEHENSRFSWTTYDTSVPESSRSLAQRIRDASPPPPIPQIPKPIMIKKRPVSSTEFVDSTPYLQPLASYSAASVVSRKPLPRANRAASAISATKDLPPVPDELSAADKMSSLTATVETLQRRRHNMNRIIRDLEENLKRNAVVYDMWKRREVERTIKNHNVELDTITQEIHEIGIQIHRAQKKKDREENYEQPTGLWIRRVTS